MSIRICVFAMFAIASSVLAFGQRLEAGVFGSYGSYGLSPFPNDAVGLGGRLNINLSSNLVVEGEGSYDFKHPRFEIATVAQNLNRVDVTTFRMGIVHGNVGLKLQKKDGTYFLFIKGGVIDFHPEITTTSQVGLQLIRGPAVSSSYAKGVLYPGGGIDFHAGILGIRVDAGDEIYWSNGARNNLRLTFGPNVRF